MDEPTHSHSVYIGKKPHQHTQNIQFLYEEGLGAESEYDFLAYVIYIYSDILRQRVDLA